MKRKRLLIVDDENLVVRALARLLANDFQVVTASSGDDALRCVTTGEPVDVVLSDITMPGMNGLEFALRAVEARPALRGRIVLMTGGAMSRAFRASLEQSRVPLIAKPFDRGQLVALVETMVR